MKKYIFLLATLAISNCMIVSSCEHINSVDRATAPPPGTVTTLAGPSFPVAGGSPLNASFKLPYGVAVDDSGNVYVADYGNNLIRKISSSGLVTTLAGSGSAGQSDGMGAAASFNEPIGIAVNSIGNVFV